MFNKNVLVPVASGIEEIECVTIVDVLRRTGISVRIASIEGREITGANGIKIIADSHFKDEALEDYDALVLPGGTEGAKRFAAHKEIANALNDYFSNNTLLGAICASPSVVLAPLGILDKRNATCYPSLKHTLRNYVDERVVVDGTVVTSQGPATAMDFALKIAAILMGDKIAQEVKAGLLA